ncbi:ComEA family DNA-binding protein [Dokdonia sp. 4H-3-7-5]|uniref:ComEA family DNA-binding protein n=1 Tax=Dokdonia sp. (strain 4H-3-7-5) TaxID=983548 RepID=UPI00020A6449|nr:helix-hairpin-helix domain-containing protein [Dokdonia sp. 4H-3-7-5]AEE18362.1 helix-hairpin-helix DNA-binding protein [Dokdonia sp. 4H-3-7-5]
MISFKSHFIYDRRKRNGIFFFMAIIIACTAVVIFYSPESEAIISKEEELKVFAFQKEIDSLKVIELEKRKPKIFPFNPALLTDFNGYKFGMTTEEIDRVLRFRESGKWFDSTAQFQKVSGVSDSLLAVMEPYFKWPKWIEEQKKSPKKKSSFKNKWKTAEEKGDLNSVSYEKLIAIDGVDEDIATRILRHRDKTGGYLVDFQLYSVFGVDKNVKRAILNEYTVKEKPVVRLVNVNTATASDLSTVPLLNFDLAKEIVDYRILREGIKSIEELKNLDGMTDFKYDIISLYLHID